MATIPSHLDTKLHRVMIIFTLFSIMFSFAAIPNKYPPLGPSNDSFGEALGRFLVPFGWATMFGIGALIGLIAVLSTMPAARSSKKPSKKKEWQSYGLIIYYTFAILLVMFALTY